MNYLAAADLLEELKKAHDKLNKMVGDPTFLSPEAEGKVPKLASHSDGEPEPHVGDSGDDEEEGADPDFPYHIDEYSEESIKLDSEDLNALDLFTAGQVSDREEAAEPCSICFLTYSEFPDEPVRELPCSHLFHKSCVDVWLKDKGKCPKCKFDIHDCI